MGLLNQNGFADMILRLRCAKGGNSESSVVLNGVYFCKLIFISLTYSMLRNEF